MPRDEELRARDLIRQARQNGLAAAEEEYATLLVDLAVKNRALNPGQLKRVFEQNDLVFGVWLDENGLAGVGDIVFKGADRWSAADSMPDRIAAIPCRSYRHALALKEEFSR
jgi:hypothetical protein